MECGLDRSCELDADCGGKFPETAILLKLRPQESKANALRAMKQERMGCRWENKQSIHFLLRAGDGGVSGVGPEDHHGSRSGSIRSTGDRRRRFPLDDVVW